MISLNRIRAIGTVSVIVLGVSMCSLRDHNLKQEGAARVVESVAKQTEKQSAKARKARADAHAVDDAVQRVRSEYCRNC